MHFEMMNLKKAEYSIVFWIAECTLNLKNKLCSAEVIHVQT